MVALHRPLVLVRGFEEEQKIPYFTGYGMTETSPLVSLSTYLSHMEHYTADEKMHVRTTQGITMPLLDMRIVNEHGEVPWDGKTMGEITIRVPWIASEYYKDERTAEAFKDGWLYTGDIAVMTPDGYIKITDRTKDLIKSGGEWISSVELENALMTHPKVFEAVVVVPFHMRNGWNVRWHVSFLSLNIKIPLRRRNCSIVCVHSSIKRGFPMMLFF